MLVGPRAGALDDSERTNDQQASKVAISLLGDGAEPLLAARRVLSRDQSDPGCELASRLEGLWVGHCCHDGGGHDHAEAGDRLKPLARWLGAMDLTDALVEPRDLHLNRLQLRND